MATLSYSIRFGTGTWESINDICSGKEVAIVGNLCSNGFKSVADTASFVLRYTGSAHYVTIANSILTAQANNTDVFVKIQKVGGAILFEGKVDLEKLSIKSTKIPTELSLSAKDYTYELDEAPKVNVVYDQKTVKQIVDGLLDGATSSTSRKSVHTWPSDGLENLKPDVPMVITTDDKTTYRQRIDVLLQEMGGYVLNLDPSDGYYKVRKVVNDTVVDSSTDAVNYMVTDALVTDRSLWSNDGLVIKYPTVVRETEKKLVYTYMPSLKDADDGKHVVGDEIEINAFWPKDGDLKATYQEFDTQYVDTAYNTNEKRQQNADLDLYYVDPGTGSTPDIELKMAVCDSDFNSVQGWYSSPALPSIYKPEGILMYPRKAWILLKNTSGKKLNLTHFEIKGKPVYRSRVNYLIAPEDCSDPFEYEANYVATQSRIEALAQFMYNLKANSTSISKWTDKWDAHNLGDKVKVQHKGHGNNGMGWLTCFIAAKSMKMIGDGLYAEYTAVAISGWTALTDVDIHTSLPSSSNVDETYAQWLANGNNGNYEAYKNTQSFSYEYMWSSSPDFVDPDSHIFTFSGKFILVNGVPVGDFEMQDWSNIIAARTSAKPYLWCRVNKGIPFRVTGETGAKGDDGYDGKAFVLKATSNTYQINKRATVYEYNGDITISCDVSGYTGTPTIQCSIADYFNAQTKVLRVPFNTSVTSITLTATLDDAPTQTLVISGIDMTEYGRYIGTTTSGVAYIDGDTYFDTTANKLMYREDDDWVELNQAGLDEGTVSKFCALAQKDILSRIPVGSVSASDYAYFNTLIAGIITASYIGAKTIELDDSEGGGVIQSRAYDGTNGFRIEANGDAYFKNARIGGASTFSGAFDCGVIKTEKVGVTSTSNSISSFNSMAQTICNWMQNTIGIGQNMIVPCESSLLGSTVKYMSYRVSNGEYSVDFYDGEYNTLNVGSLTSISTSGSTTSIGLFYFNGGTFATRYRKTNSTLDLKVYTSADRLWVNLPPASESSLTSGMLYVDTNGFVKVK